MTRDHSESDSGKLERRLGSNIGRRKFLAVGGGVGTAIFAGCTSEMPMGDDSDDGSTDGGHFRLLISDRPADIADFQRLEVTFDSARIFERQDEEADDGEAETAEDEEADDEKSTDEAGVDDEEADTGETSTEETDTAETSTEETDTAETNTEETDTAETNTEEDGTDDDVEEERGFYVLDLDDPTVDLTDVVGDKAISVFDGELSEGTYNKIELNVSNVEGVVHADKAETDDAKGEEDGEGTETDGAQGEDDALSENENEETDDDGVEAEVKVPSEKLQITKPFEVRAGEAVDFVFDINVVKRGRENSYNLIPVISESGVAGKDVEVEEVDAEDEENDETENDDSDDSNDTTS